MKISKPQQLVVLTAPVKFGRRSSLGISAGFGFRLSDARIIAHETEIWSALEQAPLSFRVLDEAMPKAFAEWMMAGHAQTLVSEETATASWAVRVEVGDCRKEIVCRAPKPMGGNFEARRSLALDFANAYGGEGFTANPVGRGHASRLPEEQPGLSLPEHYGNEGEFLAATGPMDPRWAQRAAYVSRKKRDLALDSEHREHLGWPETMDRRFFQMAPRDQWSADDHWPLVCSYALVGVGQDGEGVAGQLPPLDIRGVLRRKDEKLFETISFKRQTLWFFPDRDLGVVLFSGAVEIDDLLSDEIEHLALAIGEGGVSVAWEDLAAVASRREDVKRSPVEGIRDDELLPPAGRGWAWEYLLTPDEHPSIALQCRAYEQVRERMQHYRSIVDAAEAAAAKAGEQDLEAVGRQTRLLMAGTNLPETEMDKQDWRRLLESWPRDRRREDLIIRKADLSHMKFAGQTWLGVQLVDVDLSGCCFRDVDFKNTVFMGCSLAGASFENCSLDSCHFNESRFSESRWKLVQLATVQFVDCEFDSMSVNGGTWKNTFFSRSSGGALALHDLVCENVQMQACTFPSMYLKRCQCEGHAFIDCELAALGSNDSHWKKCSWLACRMHDSRLEYSRFSICVFVDACDLSGACWCHCYFEKLFLGDARFSGSQCECCTCTEMISTGLKAGDSHWVACDMSRSNLMHAYFVGARFERSALKDANLYGADLRSSQVRHSNLIGTNLGLVQRDRNWPRYWQDNLTNGAVEYPRRSA